MFKDHIIHISGMISIGIIGWIIIQPLNPPTIDSNAQNAVTADQVRFNGLPIFADQEAVRSIFGQPDQVHTDINDHSGRSIIWSFGRSRVVFNEQDSGKATFVIRDGSYPVQVGSLVMRVGYPAASLATTFPHSWQNRYTIEEIQGGTSENVSVGVSDLDDVAVLVEIASNGVILSIRTSISYI